MYAMDWLIDRVRFHLDPNLSTAQVLVSENPNGEITGHCIYRIEKEEDVSNLDFLQEFQHEIPVSHYVYRSTWI